MGAPKDRLEGSGYGGSSRAVGDPPFNPGIPHEKARDSKTKEASFTTNLVTGKSPHLINIAD
jgi:hypothetical protein